MNFRTLKFKFILTAVFIHLFLTAAPAWASKAALKIMCLGDSITDGHLTNITVDAYRTELGRLLSAAGWEVEFFNKGHPGFTSSGIDAIIEQDLAEINPDIVLYMIGTNDITFGNSYEHIIFYNRKTINTMLNHGVGKIYFAAVCPRFDNRRDRQLNLAQLQRELVAEFRQSGQVYLSDQSAYLSLYINTANWKQYYKDTKHPNDTGYTYMAQAWYEPMTDQTAPARISDLGAEGVGSGQIKLLWPAPADNETTERVLRYELKQSTTPITESNWAVATTVSGLAFPDSPGSNQTKTLSGLTPGSLYYFALKSEDNNGNLSLISNTAHARASKDTQPPEVTKITCDGVAMKAGEVIAAKPLIEIFLADEESSASRAKFSFKMVNPSKIKIYLDNQLVTNGLDTSGRYDSYNADIGIVSYQVKTELAAGSHSIGVEAEDYSGNAMSLYTISNLQVYQGDPQVVGNFLNYPNPFNPDQESTKFGYVLSREAEVKIYIFDYLYRPVYLINCPQGSSGGRVGYNEVAWDGRDSAGQIVSNGLYFVRLVEGRRVLGKLKIAVLR